MARTSMQNIVEDLTKLSKEKKEEYAQQFCEGNEDLKKLLLKMWNNGIQTYASCAGHDLSELQTMHGGFISNPNPYIYFDVKTLSEKQQKKLYKNLIMISKNLKLINQFDLTLDNYMGFEKHGLRIMLQNSEHSYKVLNDLFDDVLKKENLVENIKRFLIKKNKDDGLTLRELEFVDSLVALNNVSFSDYLQSSSDMSAEERIERIELEYQQKKGMFISTLDSVKTAICTEENEMGSYWFQVAEGMYTPDPHKENVYYTLRNGQEIKLNKSQLSGLKEFTDNRKFNSAKDYQVEAFENIIGEMERVICLKNANNI